MLHERWVVTLHVPSADLRHLVLQHDLALRDVPDYRATEHHDFRSDPLLAVIRPRR